MNIIYVYLFAVIPTILKRLQILLLTISSFQLTFAQVDQINLLEASLSIQQDDEAYQTLIQLSNLYYENNNFGHARNRADHAYDIANKQQNKTAMARALTIGGRALIANKKSFRGIKQIKNSIDLLKGRNETALQLNNYYILKELAEKKGRKKELANIQKIIARLESGEGKTRRPVVKKQGSKKRQLKEAEKINEALVSEIDSLKVSKESLNLNALLLQSMVEEKEAQITNMSESKAKVELMMAEQKLLLDSLAFAKKVDSLTLQQKQMELAAVQTNLKEQEARSGLASSQRNLFLSIAFIVFLLAIGLFILYKNIKSHNSILEAKNKLIQKEQERAEKLLLNILPYTVAQELKETGSARAKNYEEATVLFADFKGFSQIAKQLSPDELVAELDLCFKAFDEIITKHKLEKIKTIGDSYMCAGGLPTVDNNHPKRVIEAAIEIQTFLNKLKEKRLAARKHFFEARIGIHSGPLVAGVVGSKKFAYDIWGDTVNVAARLENTSAPGKINVSESTYGLVKDYFQFEHRGSVPVKNMGEVEMYYLLDKSTNGQQ